MSDESMERFAGLEIDAPEAAIGHCSSCGEAERAASLDARGFCAECARQSPARRNDNPAAEGIYAARADALAEEERRQRAAETDARIRAQRALPPTAGPLGRPVPASLQQPAPAVEAVNPHNLVALSLPNEVTGEVIFWQPAGDVLASELRAAFEAEGLEAKEAPEASSAEKAARRAAEAQRSPQRLVRKHPEGGWAIVEESQRGRKLSYAVIAQVRLLPSEQLEITLADVMEPEAAAIRAAVQAEYAHARAYLSASDITCWLVRSQARAVALKESGGVYFAPRATIERLRKVKRALAACGAHCIYEIPAMESAEAVVAIIDALRREAEQEVARIEGELQAEEIGKRAVRTRIDSCDELVAKIASYERLLGRELGDLRARVAGLRSKLEATATRGSMLEVDHG